MRIEEMFKARRGMPDRGKKDPEIQERVSDFHINVKSRSV